MRLYRCVKQPGLFSFIIVSLVIKKAYDIELILQELYKKVRGVLNKLTPQKFNTLVSQVRDLPIDTSERLQGVINLVFEKVRQLGIRTSCHIEM